MFDSDPNSKNGRRRSVLTQLLSSKTASQRQILLDDEASDQSVGSSFSKGPQDTADLDILGDPEVRASEGSVSQIPADPICVMLDKFPSLHHF
jgi:hypothetical protein